MRDVVDAFLGVACALHRRDTPSGLGDALRHPVRRCIEEHGAAQETGSRQHRLRLQEQVLRPGPNFQPVFDFRPERVLSWLTQGFGDGEPMLLKTWAASESPSRLTHPDLNAPASVTREIHLECPLAIEYHSISSGRTERESIPFALIDNGLRWHVRAFDRKSREFRDFVITRIKRPVVLKGQPVAPRETSNQDIQWIWIVELELIPHPAQPRPEITEYGLRHEGWFDTDARSHGCCRLHAATL